MTTTLLDAPAPPVPVTPVAYHRLARTARHRWWRPITGTMLILCALPVALVGGTGAVSAVVALFGGPDDFLSGSPEAELSLTLVTLGLFVPVVLLAARWAQRRPAGTVSSVAGRLRLAWLRTCVLWAVPLLILSFVVLSFLPGPGVGVVRVGGERLALGLAVVILLVPLQAAGEEYLFRGWILQAFGSWLRSPWPGIVVSSLLFGLAHGIGSGASLLVTGFFGLVTAVLTVRTGGLEAAIGLHVVNNVAAFGFMVVTGTMDTAETAITTPAAIVDLSMVALYGLGVLWMARRRGLATLAVRFTA
jgi:membrane protease YdiL (CAAX protease family)